MTVLTKRMISVSCLTLLSLHFFLVIIYVSPLRNVPVKLRVMASYYIGPFFHQNWCLFVPAPDAERHLYVRYLDQKEWSEWEDIFQEQIDEQRNGVILANEEEVLGLSLSLVYLSDTEEQPQKVFLTEPDTFNFQVVKKATRQYLANNNKLKHPEKFEILFSQIRKGNQTNYYFKNLSFR